MKKPSQYELKKWLVNNIISGLQLYYKPTTGIIDTPEGPREVLAIPNHQSGIPSDTDWELTTTNGDTKRMKRHLIEPLVNIDLDWVRVIREKDEVLKEVQEWDKFAKKERRDLTEYERLRKKFS